MEKIDKFELMLMDSNINILGLPDGAVEQIVELMAKCYTTRNDEVVPALTALQNIVDYLDGNPTHKIHPNTSLHAEAKLALTKLKEDKK